MTNDLHRRPSRHGGRRDPAPAGARKAAGEASDLITRTSAELDLTDQAAVRDFMQAEKPDVVILAAAKVGGIHRQQHLSGAVHLREPDDRMQRDPSGPCGRRAAPAAPGILLHLSQRWRRSRWREDALLTGTLEPTNEPYAIAKIAGIKLCESYNRQYGRDYRSGHADQPLRPRRQLSPRELPRHARADPPFPRGGARRGARRW